MTNNANNTSDASQHSSNVTNGVYEIRVKGHLDDHWKPWFEGMTLNYETAGDPEQEYTLITGPIVDQPALHGYLAKIRDLNLTLISVRRMSSEGPGVVKKSDRVP